MGRTMAVVLFTDLVGSTELRGRLGEEAADEVRRQHDQLLTRAVEANNGRVVKGLGDGIMATFSGAADAVAAAVAIQQAVDRLNRTGKAPAPLSVRVGLSAGDVAFEDDDVHGTPVIEASRLCGAAVGGEVLASEVVRWLGGAQGAPVLVPVGSLELKGLDAPVPAMRVEWEPAPASTIPMPALLTDVGRIFVGRDAELERLGQLWKEAVAGERRVALLAGEPGVGKTRLAAELAIRVDHEGGSVLAGRCDEDLGVPYQPFVEALRHFVDHTPATELKERLGRYGGELTRLLPELPERVRHLPPPLQSDPETERYRLFDAVAAWLEATAAEEPLLVVLDDLQWAAKPTLLLVRHIVRSAQLRRLLLLGTYRDTELHHNQALADVLADLRRQGDVDRIPLSGLTPTGVCAFMEQAAGHGLDEQQAAVARAIHEETEGNPFFVTEVLLHLVETGAIERRSGRWESGLPIEELGIPDSIVEVIGRRLSRLSEPANQVLRTAAVVGAEFDLPVLQTASSLDQESLVTALEQADAARLIMPSPEGYRFAHALVRDTIYRQLSAARQVVLHRLVADAIESVHAAALDDHLPALAHHWARASVPPADTARAVDFARRAGDRALDQFANDEAAQYYQQAIELLGVSGTASGDLARCDLLISLGEAQRRAGNPLHRETLLAAGRIAHALGDAERCARAALANRRGLFSRMFVVDQDRVTALEAALELVADAETATRARLLAALAGELYFATDDRRHVLANDALELARRVGDPATVAQVLAGAWYATWHPDRLALRVGYVKELIQHANRLGDRILEFHAGIALYVTAMQEGDIELADHGLAVSIGLAQDLGQPALRWWVVLTQANRAMAAGDMDTAERLAVHAHDTAASIGQPDSSVYHHGAMATIRLWQGRHAEAVDILSNFDGDRPFLPGLAWAYAELGRCADADAVLTELAKDDFSTLPANHTWLLTMSCLARASARLEASARTRRLYELLLPHRSEMIVVTSAWFGPVSYDLALLAAAIRAYDDAEQHFEEARTLLERLGCAPVLAHLHLEWAGTLLARQAPGDVVAARQLLDEALAGARKLGLATLERRAVQLLS